MTKTLSITLTDELARRLNLRAAVELRTPESMAAYLVAKALTPRKPAQKAVRRKATSRVARSESKVSPK